MISVTVDVSKAVGDLNSISKKFPNAILKSANEAAQKTKIRVQENLDSSARLQLSGKLRTSIETGSMKLPVPNRKTEVARVFANLGRAPYAPIIEGGAPEGITVFADDIREWWIATHNGREPNFASKTIFPTQRPGQSRGQPQNFFKNALPFAREIYTKLVKKEISEVIK